MAGTAFWFAALLTACRAMSASWPAPAAATLVPTTWAVPFGVERRGAAAQHQTEPDRSGERIFWLTTSPPSAAPPAPPTIASPA